MFNDRQSVIVDHFVVSQMIVTAQMAYSEFASCLCNDFFFLFFSLSQLQTKKIVKQINSWLFRPFHFFKKKTKIQYEMKKEKSNK